MLLSDKLLQTKVQTKLLSIGQIVLDNLMRLLTTVHRITEANGLVSRLFMNYGIYPNIDFLDIINATYILEPDNR